MSNHDGPLETIVPSGFIDDTESGDPDPNPWPMWGGGPGHNGS